MKTKAYRKCIAILVFIVLFLRSQAGDFVITDHGIIVRPDSVYAGNARQIHINVIQHGIIRITALPVNARQVNESLIITQRSFPGITWNVQELNGNVRLVTSKLTVVVNLENGAISFLDKKDSILIAEKPLSRKLVSAIYEGEPLYSIQQTFETLPDDAWYGLGQHQDGIMNYKSYQVRLFQNNTEVAVPFLISKRNYGILWDNYSITKVGDVRPYQSLTTLKLFSKTGDKGWLTASYSNNKN